MGTPKKKYAIRKYNGDDAYSWAVFRISDLAGKKGIIFYGDATPVVSGCNKTAAQSYCNSLNLKEAKK